MLKKAAFTFILFVLIAAASLWYYCFYLLPKDLQEYEKELKTKQAHYHLQKNTPPCFTQNRVGIRKDMWIFTLNSMEHHHIEAATGSLVVKKSADTWDVKEHLQDVSCLLDSPNHELKLLQTKEGLYHYKTKNFSSPQVNLFYLNPPTRSFQTVASLPVTAFQAKALNVSFCLNAPQLTFQAQHFFGMTQNTPK